MKLIDIEPGDPRLAGDVLSVLRELRPELTAQSLHDIYTEGYPQGYRFTAAFDPDGRCVGVAGWRIIATTVAGRKLYIDDLVTTESARGLGVGKALLAELTQRARAAGCTILDLDSGTFRKDAHRFYMRERLTISAFHFQLPL
ncbi:GNAT family N-acetyltransferase [Allorhizocola rhizosphaerae]|uniref:GNAT family N-acetyltransferase n=1 Tax=Allorhizocola rhizosphaerae TaxID=1872709 RepID=UPI000E3CDEA8|nr:GNAT family N-acetyltransferase [Allorhizocola rhizosphaerae]